VNQETDLLIALLAGLSLTPLGFFLPCLPCCQESCSVNDGKPRTDPKDEGTWVPSGTWNGVGGVTWTFTANPGDESGETWFFYGSASTSRAGGGATTQEIQDWYNICNWYSHKTTAPDDTFSTSIPLMLTKRATRLPPENAVVHIYAGTAGVTTVSNGTPTIKAAYFWFSRFPSGSELTCSGQAHDSTYGVVYYSGANAGTFNGGVKFVQSGTQIENESSAVINGGAEFLGAHENYGTVNDGAIFRATSSNWGSVNGGGSFYGTASNWATVNGGSQFYDSAINRGTVNGGAVFSDSSFNASVGTVNDGATFNDSACSERVVGSFFATPCSRKFVAHPSDLPTCNGTAPDGCASLADTCGCG
jgi:hypothetical protein